MNQPDDKAKICRRRADELRSLARLLTLPEARKDTLNEATKWELLAASIEADEQRRQPNQH